jgi:hypothetical protein
MTVDRIAPEDGLAYRLLVGVDLEGYSRLHALEQSLVQARLGRVMDDAAAGSGLDRGRWFRQPKGDGELSVLPADVDAASVLGGYPGHLGTALADLRRDGVPLRLRVAMHCGAVTTGRFGLVGDAPIVTCRLLDASSVRRALRESADDLVLVISKSLYEDVVCTRFHGLDPARFRRTRFSTKGKAYTGYLSTGVPRPGFPNS